MGINKRWSHVENIGSWHELLFRKHIFQNLVTQKEMDEILGWTKDNNIRSTYTTVGVIIGDYEYFWLSIYLTKSNAMAFKLKWT